MEHSKQTNKRFRGFTSYYKQMDMKKVPAFIWQPLSYYLNLRSRYIFTPARIMRLRYSVPGTLAILLASTAAVGHMTPHSNAHTDVARQLANVNPAAGTPVTVENTAYTRRQDLHNLSPSSVKPSTQQVAANTIDLSNTSSQLPESFFKKIEDIKKNEPVAMEIGKGETVTGQLTKLGISGSDAYKIVDALSEHIDPRHVRAGQVFNIEFDTGVSIDQEFRNLAKMTVPISPAKQIVVARAAENAFQATEVEKEVKKRLSAGRANLKYSLYGSAAKAGIPDEVIAKLIKIYSWNVDFQRDIRSGDEIEILYEREELEDGTAIGYGDIIYARLLVSGKDIPLYRYESAAGRVDYFDRDGISIRRTLMKTPIDGARMSSGYGMRHHPVLGYSKMHKGVDFAAPTGTPIYAAGNGTVELAGRRGSYGNFIRIRHNGSLKTAYAHLSKIKSGVTPGARINQGEIIGYVGTTGRSTGPHLHYEVLVDGKHANPRGVNIPTGEQLQGTELVKFHTQMRKYDQEYAALTKGADYAMALPKDEKKSSN